MPDPSDHAGARPDPEATLREASRLAGEAVALFRRAIGEVLSRRADVAGAGDAPQPGSGLAPDGSPIPALPEPLREAVGVHAVACIGYGRSRSFEALRSMAATYDELCLVAAAHPPAQVPSDFARDVIAERARQVDAEGWSTTHDDAYPDGTLSRASASYLLAADATAPPPSLWGFLASWWKPADRRRNLVRGAALAIAEGERLDRATGRPVP